MVKVKYAITALLTFLILMSSSKAIGNCNYEEKAKLNNEAANVKVNFEIKSRVLDPDEYSLPDSMLGATEEEIEEYRKTVTAEQIVVNVLNLTENLYIEVSNNVNKEKKRYNYSDSKDGNISFVDPDPYNTVVYTIKVNSSNATNCANNTLSTLYQTLPRYNDLSEFGICESIPDFYMCQKYVEFDDVGEGTFLEAAQKELDKQYAIKEEEKKQNKWYRKTWNFIKEHKVVFIIGGVVLIAAGTATTVIIIKKRRRDVI